MTDFGSIYSMANRPTVAPENPMDAMGKMMSLKNLGQQVEQGQMQTQQMQQQLNDAQELRDTIKQAATAGADPVQAVRKLGSPAAQSWMKSYTDMALSKTKLDKEQWDLSMAHLSKVGGDVIGASQQGGATPQQVAALIDSHVKQGNIPPEQAQELKASLPQDPSQLGVWGLTQGAKLGASKELLALFKSDHAMVDQGTSTQPVAINTTLGTVKKLGEALPKDIGPGELAKFANDIPGGMNPDGTINMNNPHVAAKAKAMETNMATVMGGGAGFGSGLNPSNPLPDPGMEAVAQAIARGAQAPQEYSLRNPAAKIINARAAMIGNGDLQGKTEVAAHGADLASFAAGGKNGQTINAINTMTEHLGTMEKAINALKLGQIPAANKIGQAIGIQFGDDAATNAQVIRGFLSGEVAKVASGGHLTEGEIGKAESNIKTAGSPAQAMGALSTMREIAGGKLTALNQDYQRITGKNLAEGGRLTPATAAAFQDVFAKQNQQHQGNEQSPTAPTVQFNQKWQPLAAAGTPDTNSIGRNPRFKTSVWVGKDAPDGPGWYVNLGGGQVRRVE